MGDESLVFSRLVPPRRPCRGGSVRECVSHLGTGRNSVCIPRETLAASPPVFRVSGRQRHPLPPSLMLFVPLRSACLLGFFRSKDAARRLPPKAVTDTSLMKPARKMLMQLPVLPLFRPPLLPLRVRSPGLATAASVRRGPRRSRGEGEHRGNRAVRCCTYICIYAI